MTEVLEKIYTTLDSFFNFLDWICSGLTAASNWLVDSWHTVTSFLAACPASIVAVAAAVFALGLLCLLLNR